MSNRKWEMMVAASVEIREGLLEEGWEPFSVDGGFVWFRRAVQPERLPITLQVPVYDTEEEKARVDSLVDRLVKTIKDTKR